MAALVVAVVATGLQVYLAGAGEGDVREPVHWLTAAVTFVVAFLFGYLCLVLAGRLLGFRSFRRS